MFISSFLRDFLRSMTSFSSVCVGVGGGRGGEWFIWGCVCVDGVEDMYEWSFVFLLDKRQLG